MLARLRALIDKRGSVAVDGEIALGDALHLRIERALHHFVFSQALEGMTDGLTEAIDLTGTIDPPHAIAAKLRLELFAEVARQDIALNERIAEISDAHRTVQLLDTCQLLIEMVHAARLPLTIIGNHRNTFRRGLGLYHSGDDGINTVNGIVHHDGIGNRRHNRWGLGNVKHLCAVCP